MSEMTKEKWISRAVYILLALLLIAVLTMTVVAIVSTVSARKEDDLPVIGEPDDGGADNGQTDEKVPDDTGSGNEDSEGENPGDGAQTSVDPVYCVPSGGYLMKGYSEDVLVFSSTMNDYRVHLGADIAGKVGDQVCAFTDGRIEKIYSDPFMGKSIVIDHGNGLKSRYMNLADALPEGIGVGSEVKSGTVIGAIGETAIAECADSPHLHFELLLGGKRVDPTAYIKVPEGGDTTKE